MSTPTSTARTLFTHAMIGLSAVAGLHFAWAGPASDSAAQTRAAADAREADIREADAARDAVPKLDRELGELRAEAQRVRADGRLVRDPSGLFAAVGAIAEAAGVRIDQMDPLGERSAKSGSGPGPDLCLSYRITARAAYPSIAAFIRSVASELGQTRIRSASFSPVDGGANGQVTATIETEHFLFDIPQSAAALLAEGGGSL